MKKQYMAPQVICIQLQTEVLLVGSDPQNRLRVDIYEEELDPDEAE